MRAGIKAQIAPGSTASNSKTFGAGAKPVEKNVATDNIATKKADFKSLILNSEAEVKKQRSKEKANDFSSAKSDEEFLEMLQNSGKKKPEAKNKLDKNSFLNLFVAQLKNQDPLNPDDGAQMASKLAQFHSLEEMININTNLDTMIKDSRDAALAAKIDFVGKEVEIEDTRLNLKKDQKVDINFQLDRDADQVLLEIHDSNNNVVFSKALGPHKAGRSQFEWPGTTSAGKPAKPGVYTMSLEATDRDGLPVDFQAIGQTTITGVSLKGDSGIFSTLGKIETEAIRSIGLKDYKKPAKQQSGKGASVATPAATKPDSEQPTANAPVSQQPSGSSASAATPPAPPSTPAQATSSATSSATSTSSPS